MHETDTNEHYLAAVL